MEGLLCAAEAGRAAIGHDDLKELQQDGEAE
jgi:hypothetical protein